MTEQLKALHALWCKLTGQSPDEVRYSVCERLLFEYVQAGFTEDNLLHVITFICHQNAKASHPRYRTRLIFRRIFDLENFASLLGEAGPWFRNRQRKPTVKEQTLNSFRGLTPAPETGNTARHFSEVLQAVKLNDTKP